jgi:hypothetical protein
MATRFWARLAIIISATTSHPAPRCLLAHHCHSSMPSVRAQQQQHHQQHQHQHQHRDHNQQHHNRHQQRQPTPAAQQGNRTWPGRRDETGRIASFATARARSRPAAWRTSRPTGTQATRVTPPTSPRQSLCLAGYLYCNTPPKVCGFVSPPRTRTRGSVRGTSSPTLVGGCGST